MTAAVEAPPISVERLRPDNLSRRWWRCLFAPVDIASLVVFRILFGAIMLVEVGRYYGMGWINSYYIAPKFHFTYYGFDWVKPWPGVGMYIHFAVIGIAALGVMLGCCYRFSAASLFVTFTYVFLLDQAYYLNHFYMISLVSFLMIFIPAHRALSIDVLRKPWMRSDFAPAWALGLLLAQLSIVYFYAGIAKLNADWLDGEPFRSWLAERTSVPVIGKYFTEEWLVMLFNYGGLAFDLFIVPLLLWRRTRVFAFLWAASFHFLNATIFSIGIFPWLMLAATTLYFRPDWPRRIFRRWRWTETTGVPEPAAYPPLALSLIGVYLAIQLLVPFRHFLYPGNVHWTEEGHRFSWHMKLRDKESTARFIVTDAISGRSWHVSPRLYLTPRQMNKMSNRPDMILRMAHHIAKDQARRRNIDHPLEVRATVMTSLNRRRQQLLIDPTVNLAAVERSLRPARWILPFEASRPE